MRRFVPVVLMSFFSVFAFSQNTDFSAGEELFYGNKCAEAIPYLERSLAAGDNPKTFIYLPLCYQQVKQYDKALAVCEKGMATPGTNKKVVSYNAGNIAFEMGDFSGAENWYTLSISADSTYDLPVLNRANTRLKQGKYDECVADYENYLKLAPENPQGNAIKTVIYLIKNQQENAKKADAIKVEQERKAKEDDRRTAAEKAKQEVEEAARRKKLLEDAASSLQDSASEKRIERTERSSDYDFESPLF